MLEAGTQHCFPSTSLSTAEIFLLKTSGLLSRAHEPGIKRPTSRRPGFLPTLSQSDWKLVYEFSYAFEFDTLWIRSAEKLSLDVSPLDKILIGRRRDEPTLVQLGLREFALSDAPFPPDGSKQASILEYGGLMTIISLRSAQVCGTSRAVEIINVSPQNSADETDDDRSLEGIATSPVETFTYHSRSLAISESIARAPDSPTGTHSDFPLPDKFPIRLTHPRLKFEPDASEVPFLQAVNTLLDSPRKEEVGISLIAAEGSVRTDTPLLVPSASTAPDTSEAALSQRTAEIVLDSPREEELITGFVPSSSVVATRCEIGSIPDPTRPAELADPTVRFNISFSSVPTVRQHYEGSSAILMQDNSFNTNTVTARAPIGDKYAIKRDGSSGLPSTCGAENSPVQTIPDSSNSAKNTEPSVPPDSSDIPTTLDMRGNSYTTSLATASTAIEEQIIPEKYAPTGGAFGRLALTGATSQSAVPDPLKSGVSLAAVESSEIQTPLDMQFNSQISSFGSIHRGNSFSLSMTPSFAWGGTASKVQSRIGPLHKEDDSDEGPLRLVPEIRSLEPPSVSEGLLVDTSIPTASTPTPAACSPKLLELVYHNRSSSPSFWEATLGPNDSISLVDHTEYQATFLPTPLSATIPLTANLLDAPGTLLETENLNEKGEDELGGDSEDNGGLNKSDDDEAEVQDEDEEGRIVSKMDSRKRKNPSDNPAVDDPVEANEEGSEDNEADSNDDEEKDGPGSKPADKKKKNKNKKGGKGGKGKKGKKGR